MSNLELRAVGGTAEQRKMCRDLVRFSLPYLMKKPLINKLSIRINIKPDYVAGHGLYGLCDINDWESRGRPRRYSISVDGSMLTRPLLTTVAHELVHVKQYATGDLTFNTKTGDNYWHGKLVDEDMNYWLHPWEIEAFGWERNLVELFIDENGWRKKKNTKKFSWIKEEYYHGERYWKTRGNKIAAARALKLKQSK